MIVFAMDIYYYNYGFKSSVVELLERVQDIPVSNKKPGGIGFSYLTLWDKLKNIFK